MSYTTEFVFSSLISCVIILIVTGFSSFHNSSFRYGVIGYVFCLMMILIEHLIEYSGYSSDFPHTIYFSSAFYFAMAPMLNLVIGTLFKQSVKRKQLLLEMIPAIVVPIWMIPFYLLSGDAKYQYLLDYISCQCMAPRHIALIVILLIQTTIYSVYWYRKIRNYVRHVKSKASSSTIEFIPWISRILVVIILFGLSIVATGITRVFWEESFYMLDKIENITFSFIPHTFLLLLFFLHEKSLPQIHVPIPAEPNGRKIIKSEQVDLLLDLMNTQKLYLNPDLNLADVADHMRMSRHHLSELLSQGVLKNFYDFVNEYRIEHAKDLMSSEVINAYSLSGIARESGFNNYVSFYRVFKRTVGLTPSKFMENK